MTITDWKVKVTYENRKQLSDFRDKEITSGPGAYLVSDPFNDKDWGIIRSPEGSIKYKEISYEVFLHFIVKKGDSIIVSDYLFEDSKGVIHFKAVLPAEEKVEKKVIIKEKKEKMSIENAILDKVVQVVTTDKSVEEKLLLKLEGLGIVPTEKVIILKEYDKSFKKSSEQHEKFELVLKSLDVRANLALVGPAGSGKTTIVSEAAKVLDLEFYSKSVSIQTGTHEFFGYYDANGQYVPTLFRKAYEEGGIFLLDEFDAGNPNVLAALNQSVANDSCAFPDKMVPKHKDFIMVVAGNTYGSGATMEYIGRNKIDAATLDRFVFLTIDYDEKFETKLAKDKVWCRKVQEFRKKAITKGLKCVISPRATFYGEMLLLAGIPEKTVIEMTIYKGLTETEINLLK